MSFWKKLFGLGPALKQAAADELAQDGRLTPETRERVLMQVTLGGLSLHETVALPESAGLLARIFPCERESRLPVSLAAADAALLAGLEDQGDREEFMNILLLMDYIELAGVLPDAEVDALLAGGSGAGAIATWERLQAARHEREIAGVVALVRGAARRNGGGVSLRYMGDVWTALSNHHGELNAQDLGEGLTFRGDEAEFNFYEQVGELYLGLYARAFLDAGLSDAAISQLIAAFEEGDPLADGGAFIRHCTTAPWDALREAYAARQKSFTPVPPGRLKASFAEARTAYDTARATLTRVKAEVGLPR